VPHLNTHSPSSPFMNIIHRSSEKKELDS